MTRQPEGLRTAGIGRAIAIGLVLLGAAADPAHGFNIDTARTLFGATQAVKEQPAAAIERMRQMGGTETRFLDGARPAAQAPGFFDPASQVMVTKMVQNGKTVFVVTFRGTEPNDPRDFQTDLNFRGTSMSAQLKNVKVHTGFLKTANLGVEALRPVLAQLRTDPNAEVVFTGHSMGGAAAVVAAAQMVEAGVPRNKISAYTFGAPAAGNRAFARRYRDLKIYRVERPEDPVPRLLDNAIMGFHHIGKRAVLDNGTLTFEEPRRRGILGRIVDGFRTLLGFFGIGRAKDLTFTQHRSGEYEAGLAAVNNTPGLSPAEVASSTRLVPQAPANLPPVSAPLPGAGPTTATV